MPKGHTMPLKRLNGGVSQEVEAQMLLQVVPMPGIVIAGDHGYVNSFVGPSGERPKQPGQALGNEIAVLYPCIEQVSEENNMSQVTSMVVQAGQ